MDIINQIDMQLDRFNHHLTDNEKAIISSIPFDSINELRGMRAFDARLSKDEREGILVFLVNENGEQYVVDIESARFPNRDALIFRSIDKVGINPIFRMVYPDVNEYPLFFNYPRDNHIVEFWGRPDADAHTANKIFDMTVYVDVLLNRTISDLVSYDKTINIKFSLEQKDGHLFLTNIMGIELENQEPIDIGESSPLCQALNIMKAGNYIVDSLLPKEISHTHNNKF